MSRPARGPMFFMGIDGNECGLPSPRDGSHRCDLAKPLKALGGRFLACCLVAVAGCTTAPEKPAENVQVGTEHLPEVMVESLQSEPDRALRFYDRIMRLRGAELVGALEAARQAHAVEGSDLTRLELAMILSLPGASFRDDPAAAQLLQPFARDPAREASPLRPLALLLLTQLVENRRQEEALQQQAAKAKEEQRKAEDLQQKLDALLDMEKKLIEREQSIPTKKK
jgi:hypothetical protein